jgi:hypothetical protein
MKSYTGKLNEYLQDIIIYFYKSFFLLLNMNYNLIHKNSITSVRNSNAILLIIFII